MKRLLAIAGLALLLAGCGESTMARPATPVSTVIKQPPLPANGLERVMGQNAAGLTQTFGTPNADVREGTARKLQFETRLEPGEATRGETGDRELAIVALGGTFSVDSSAGSTLPECGPACEHPDHARGRPWHVDQSRDCPTRP